MHDLSIPQTKRSSVPAKSIALPVEHGAWGFLLEPLLAGMLIAPTLASPFICIFVIGAFLSRQPLKFVVGDALKRKRLPRTEVAIRYLAIFGSIALTGFVLSFFTADPKAFIPFAAAAPFVIYLIMQDAARQSREMLSELLAAAVLAASIASLALAGGLGYLMAAVLWITMLARLIPSVLYVRSRLRLEKGKEYNAAVPLAAHIAGLAVVTYFWYLGLGSVLVVAMAAFLLGRSALGLTSYRGKLTAKQLGVREVIYGIVYAAAVVAGYYTKL